MKKAITTAVCLLAAMLTLVGCSCSTNSTAPTEGTQQVTAAALDDEKDYSSYKPVKPSKLKDVIDTNKVARLSRINNEKRVFSEKSDDIALFKSIIDLSVVNSDSGIKPGSLNIRVHDKDGKELYNISSRAVDSGIIYIEENKTYVSFKLNKNDDTKLLQLYISLIGE
ncbi:unknown [Clostridium sp. CAG:964]|nr:unknown [Clostridium sp. CAG:964]